MENEHEIEFGTIGPDGLIGNVRMIKQSDIAKCPLFILVPEHYKADGTCLCFDPDEKARIRAERETRREKYMNVAARQAAKREEKRS